MLRLWHITLTKKKFRKTIYVKNDAEIYVMKEENEFGDIIRNTYFCNDY